MADPRTPLVHVETLRNPRTYPPDQLNEVFLIAYRCMERFGSVRFVYAQPPRD